MQRSDSVNKGGFLLVAIASAVVFLADWGSAGLLLAGLWTSLLAFWTVDRNMVRPYLYQASLAVLLTYPGLQSFDERGIDQRIEAECGKSMSHTVCGHELTEDWLSHGLGLPVNAIESVERYRQASLSGDPRGDCGLGWMAEHGAGRPADIREAMHHYERAARAGNSCAQFLLANIHERGAAGVPNLEQSARWYTRAAAAGDREAAARLEVVMDRLSRIAGGPMFAREIPGA